MANYNFGTPIPVTVNPGITGIYTTNSLVATFDPEQGRYYELNFDVTNSNSGATDKTSDSAFVTAFHQHMPYSVNSWSADDEYQELIPSFDVYFDGTNYASFFLGSNGYITFGGYSTAYNNLSATTPSLNKIFISSRDLHSVAYAAQEFGTAPNRVFMGFLDGYQHQNSAVTHRWWFKFYEQHQNRMDLWIETNDGYYGYNFNSGTGTAVSPGLTQGLPTTLSNIIFNPVTSIGRITSPYTPNNYSNLGAGSAVNSQRPVSRSKFGQLWPRGVYNK